MKKQEKIIIRTEGHRQRAMEIVSRADIGNEVIVRKHSEPKTIPQLAYTFGVIYPAILKFVDESLGESFTVDEMHKWMKKAILGVDYKELSDTIIEVEKELKKSDREAWSAYIDSVIHFCWNRWGLMVPAPYWKGDAA